jgi:hypothetical protein
MKTSDMKTIVSTFVILLTLLILTLTGCASNHEKYSFRSDFPDMYSEQPRTIFVLPAVNVSTAADASEYYATTIAEPLTQKGYYVLPIPITSELMKREGVVDGAQLRQTNLSLFKNHFGADAVMFVTIKQWDTNYSVISGSVSVAIDFELVSAMTSKRLWHFENQVVVNTTENSQNSGGLLGAIIATAIKTALQDYMPVAKDVTRGAVARLPAGPYHSKYGTD